MRLTVILVALACAMPALAQQETNGPDTTSDVAAQLEEQRHVGALAVQALRDGDFSLARRYALRLTQEAPINLGGWLTLGQAETGLKDWKAASRTYSTAVRIKPSSPEAHAGLGIALARRGSAGAAKQLAWLTAKAQTCGLNCGQLAKLKSDVEAAIAAGAVEG